MFRKCILPLVVLVALAGTVWAWTLEPFRGWATAVQLDKAVEAAKKSNCPIVFLYSEKEADDPSGKRRMSLARVYMKLTGLGGMMKVLVYTSVRPPSLFQRVANQVQEPDEETPLMYFATPELKILGFVLSGSHKATANKIAGHARNTMIWINKCRAEIKAVEKDAAENGRFGTALETYKRIAVEDKRKAILTHMTWNIVLSMDEVDNFYFPEIGTKIEELTPMAEARLGQARTAFNNKDYKEVVKLLRIMVENKGDLEAVREAVELLAKAEENLKEK